MIEITNVHKSFGTVPVLKGISLNVRQGEVVCLIGASGSGKSTLLRCINALESYDEGEIRLLGERVEQRARNINQLRTQVGMSGRVCVWKRDAPRCSGFRFSVASPGSGERLRDHRILMQPRVGAARLAIGWRGCKPAHLHDRLRACETEAG